MTVVHQIPLGGIVLCDTCNTNYTDSEDEGGFVFSGYAICPTCAVKMKEEIDAAGESWMIWDTCRDGETFADFVRRVRGEHDSIIIIET